MHDWLWTPIGCYRALAPDEAEKRDEAFVRPVFYSGDKLPLALSSCFHS